MGIGQRAAAVAGQVRHRYGGRDRAGEYARLLRLATDAGYELVGLEAFARRTAPVDGADGGPEARGAAARPASVDAARPRLLALRHDVDITDVAGNWAFYELELAAGARSTFYFRWTTADRHRRLVRRLLADGFEVGYHYEEGATIAKRHALASRDALLARHDEVESLMRERTAAFRRHWNPALASAASHGDWMNRRLGVANHELVTPGLLEACGLAFEAYGERILGRADVYVSDVGSPSSPWARGYSLEDAIADGHPWICLLTHERRWHVSRVAALEADGRRVLDELRVRVRGRLGGPGRRARRAREDGRPGEPGPGA